MSLEQIASALQRAVGDDTLQIVAPQQLTDARLQPIETNDGRRWLLKRLTPSAPDAIATRDDRQREFQFAAIGMLRSLPALVGSPVVAAIQLDDTPALLMADVSEHLLHSPLEIPAEQRLIEALAALHGAFVGFPARLQAGLGLPTLGSWLTLNTGADWSRFTQQAPATWQVVAPLLQDPMPLVRALREFPETILHGDLQPAHIGLSADQLLLLDWGQVLRAPAALDLADLLAQCDAVLPSEPDALQERYRLARAAQGRLPTDPERWQQEFRLAQLAAVLRHGWQLVESRRFDAWCSVAEQAARELSEGIRS